MSKYIPTAFIESLTNLGYYCTGGYCDVTVWLHGDYVGRFSRGLSRDNPMRPCWYIRDKKVMEVFHIVGQR